MGMCPHHHAHGYIGCACTGNSHDPLYHSVYRNVYSAGSDVRHGAELSSLGITTTSTSARRRFVSFRFGSLHDVLITAQVWHTVALSHARLSKRGERETQATYCPTPRTICRSAARLSWTDPMSAAGISFARSRGKAEARRHPGREHGQSVSSISADCRWGLCTGLAAAHRVLERYG